MSTVGIVIVGFILCVAGLGVYYFTRDSLGRRGAMIGAVVVASIIAFIFKGC